MQIEHGGSPEEKTIRILIADDHPVVRRGLRRLIATTTDIVIAGEAANGAEVIDQLYTSDVDLLLLDMTMPGMRGGDLIRRVRAEWLVLPILVLSFHNDAQVASRAIFAGANGYVTKDSDPVDLLVAIRKLANGSSFIDPKLVDAIVFETRSTDASPLEILSNRESQVLQLLVAGESLNRIAEVLAINAKTISSHKMRLMQKLRVANNVELIRHAIKSGLVAE